ncbi:uncharacterized protein LOC113974102 [Neopelma chrysocephalum]|uniref:uncharacterized protein LOC113974102 n=1 Tax=Neopelma chrysocephalum TaxID=114329 RepID=UPI000FCCF3FB|nr:uncharacterized protein LOC113974102 [Neopelma chrysocephalum]
MTPYDTKMIVSTFLSPHQQLQFYQRWQAGCDAAAAIPRHQGNPLFGVTTQMLMGTGPFERADRQVQFVNEVLQLSQELAQKAIQAVHDDETGPSFTTVQQGPTEPFGKFIDRLHHAINTHPDLDENMKAKFLNMLAYANANEKTKRALSVLPRGSTTAQLLEAADRMIQQEKAADVATAVGAEVKPLMQKGNKPGKRKTEKKCYNWGKKGHFKAQCPAGQKGGPQGAAVPKWCENCQKDNHNTHECRRKRNRRLSAWTPRAMNSKSGCLDSCRAATTGSARVDLATAVDVTLETQED